MRIILSSALFPPHVGGAERYTENLAAALSARGHAVTVVTSDVGSREEGDRQGYEVLRLRSLPLVQGRCPVPLRCGANRDVYRILQSRGADGVIINCRFYLQSLRMARLARAMGCTPIVIEHGSDYLRMNKKLPDAALRLYEHGITALLKRREPVFYGVSEASCRWLATFGAAAAGTLYNAIDAAAIQTLAAEKIVDYRSLCGAGEDTVVIAYTGRLLPQKKILRLIAAVEELAAERSVRLLIAGDGELEEEVKRHASPSIVPLGRLDLPHVAALLGAADIFCLPSDTEGFSASVLEAAAAGCYIVATAVGGTPQLLPDESYGTLLPDNETATIASALRRACEDAPGRAAAAARTRERVERLFTWEKTAEAAERAIEERRAEHDASADHHPGV